MAQTPNLIMFFTEVEASQKSYSSNFSLMGLYTAIKERKRDKEN